MEQQSTEITNPNPDPQFDSGPVSSEKNLLAFCLESYQNTPPIYKSVEHIHEGISIWKSTVKHSNDTRLFGFGEASTKLQSRELAAINVIEALINGVITNDDETSPQETQNTNPGIASISNIVEIETDVDDNQEPGMEQSFDSMPSGATPQLIAAIHKYTMEKVTEQFEQLLRNALDSMADLFDARIQNVLDETVENKLSSFAAEKVQQQIDQKTTRDIKNEINLLSKTAVTESMKDQVINSVAKTISNKANQECTQIFENRLKVELGKLVTTHKRDISDTATVTTNTIIDTKDQAIKTVTETTDNK